jgi:hypothetical protein
MLVTRIGRDDLPEFTERRFAEEEDEIEEDI